MIDDDVEARLRSALDELTGSVESRHADGPRTTWIARSSTASDGANSIGPAIEGRGTLSSRRPFSWADPKLVALAACVLLVLVGIGLVGLSHAHRHQTPNTGSTPTSIPSTTTTVPSTPTTTTPSVPPSTSLPISVQSDGAMHAAGNDGPSSSVLLPSSCVLSGDTVTAIGTYQGGFAPNVYNRVGGVVVLYVMGAPSAGNPQAAQLGASPISSSPPMGSGTWQVSTTVDRSKGGPASCIVAAQPTHQIQLAH